MPSGGDIRLAEPANRANLVETLLPRSHLSVSYVRVQATCLRKYLYSYGEVVSLVAVKIFVCQQEIAKLYGGFNSRARLTFDAR